MSSERQLNSENNPWWGEHLHRYQEAAKLLPKKHLKILDIACGSGFGSDFLAQLGNTVIGGDVSESAIAECRSKFNRSDISFEVVDGTNLPYTDETFDVIISFETIEHTTKYQKMLNEFKRVVKKDGVIILSTPNFLINSPTGIIVNPYHTQEWTYEELYEILNNTFSNVKLLGQAYTRYRNKRQLKYRIGKIVENIFYTRGVRKLPISFQDKTMKMLIGEPMYPLPNNYSFVEELNEIKKCKTFFAICKP
ncbi:MAG: class I SAM-dependent methyltransferase [Bacteroidetes bacterium]|nr:class I SAM-dependent methyltransferase [Bacteroidota bacterium]